MNKRWCGGGSNATAMDTVADTKKKGSEQTKCIILINTIVNIYVYQN